MKRKSRSELFLLELIFVTLVFAVSAAVCTSVFAKAYTVSRESGELDFGVRTARSCIEVVKSRRGNVSECAEILGAKADNNSITLYFDEDMNSTQAESAPYKAVIEFKENCRFTVSVSGKDGEIYSLESAYIKEGAE